MPTEKIKPENVTTEQAALGVKRDKPKRPLKSVSDHLGEGEFYPDKPRIDFKELLGKTLVLKDAKILKDFHGDYGTHDAALFLFVDDEAPEGEEEFTSINSGQVVVERIKRLLEKRLLPCMATVVKTEGERGNSYYNLI